MANPRFWNWIAKRYARTPVADQESYEHKLALTKALLSPTDHILEVGCGTGLTALWHAPHVASVEGTDFSSKMIEIAQEKARGVANVTFRTAKVDDPPLRLEYNAVLAMSVLHLLPDPGHAVARLTRLLAPGGYLVSSTVCIGDLGGPLPKLLPYLGWTGLLPSVKSLHKSDLVALHKTSGLTILEEFQPEPGQAVFLIAQSLKA